MKKIYILGALALTAFAPDTAVAQVNSPDADGYFARGVAMYRNRNYNGCIDQLVQLRHFGGGNVPAEEALYYMAMATLHCGDDEALELLREFLTVYPQSPLTADVTAAIGDYYFTRENYPEAVGYYSKVNPASLTADRAEDMNYRSAYSAMMLDDDATARRDFSAVAGTRTYGNAALFYLAYLDYADGNYDSALTLFSKVDTSREPGNAAPCYLSQIYYMRGDYGRALDVASKALASGVPEEFVPELNRVAGESAYCLGRQDTVSEYLGRYVASVSDPAPSACYILGVMAYGDADYSLAADYLRRALDLPDAMGQSAYLYLGQSLVRTGNVDGALLAFENAWRSNSDSKVAETAFYNYIVARNDGGRVPFGKSAAMMEEFIGRYPSSPYANNVRENLAEGYVADGDYESALRVLRQMKQPTKASRATLQKVLFVLGTVEYRDNRTAAAQAYFREVAGMDGVNSGLQRQGVLWLANCDFDREEYDAAARRYMEYLGMAPADDANRSIAYYNLGYARMNSGLYADALTDFNRAASMPGISSELKADACNRAGDCLYYQRRFNEAARQYRKAYDANPGAGDYALYQIASMKGLDRDYSGMVAGLDDMIDRFPESALVPSALLDKAEAYVTMGKTSKAIDTYATLVREYPSTSQGRNGYLQLAVTQLGSGNREAAAETYRKVIYTYPTSEEAQVAVEDLKQICAEDGRLAEFAQFLNSVPNAPRIDPQQLDAIAFRTAETEYLENNRTSRLEDYISENPHGNYRARALYYLAEAAAEAGDVATATGYASQVVTMHPDADVAEDALLLKGSMELKQGQDELAVTTYRDLEARASSAKNLQEARIGIMQAALSLERYSEVISVSNKLLASSASGDTDMRAVRFMRAVALDRSGRNEEAYDLWNGLSDGSADEYSARSLVYMAESKLRAGDAAQAAAMADKLINAGTSHNYWLARAFIVLSDALRRQGKVFEADEYLKSLRNNYPGADDDIQQMVSERLDK